MYTPVNRDLDALGRYVPFLASSDADVAPFGVADLARGQYLCEVCHDAMTDDVVAAAQSPTGTEIAICGACRGHEGGA